MTGKLPDSVPPREIYFSEYRVFKFPRDTKTPYVVCLNYYSGGWELVLTKKFPKNYLAARPELVSFKVSRTDEFQRHWRINTFCTQGGLYNEVEVYLPLRERIDNSAPYAVFTK